MSRTLIDDTYTLHVYGNDTVGNVFHTSVTFTVDTSIPTTTAPSTTSIGTESDIKKEDSNGNGLLDFEILPGLATMGILMYSYRIRKRKRILK